MVRCYANLAYPIGSALENRAAGNDFSGRDAPGAELAVCRDMIAGAVPGCDCRSMTEARGIQPGRARRPDAQAEGALSRAAESFLWAVAAKRRASTAQTISWI